MKTGLQIPNIQLANGNAYSQNYSSHIPNITVAIGIATSQDCRTVRT